MQLRQSPVRVPVVCFGAQAGLLAFYPRYAAVVPLLPVLLVAAQFLALNNGASLFLFAAGKQGRAAILTGVTVVLDVVVAYGLAARGLRLRHCLGFARRLSRVCRRLPELRQLALQNPLRGPPRLSGRSLRSRFLPGSGGFGCCKLDSAPELAGCSSCPFLC